MKMKEQDRKRRKELKRQLAQKPAPIRSVRIAIEKELEQIKSRDEIGKRFCVDCDKVLTGKKRIRCQPCQSKHTLATSGRPRQTRLHPCGIPGCEVRSSRDEMCTEKGVEICNKCFRSIYDKKFDDYLERRRDGFSAIGNGIVQAMGEF